MWTKKEVNWESFLAFRLVKDIVLISILAKLLRDFEEKGESEVKNALLISNKKELEEIKNNGWKMKISDRKNYFIITEGVFLEEMASIKEIYETGLTCRKFVGEEKEIKKVKGGLWEYYQYSSVLVFSGKALRKIKRECKTKLDVLQLFTQLTGEKGNGYFSLFDDKGVEHGVNVITEYFNF